MFLQGLIYLIGLRLLALPHNITDLGGFCNVGYSELVETFFTLAPLDGNPTSNAIMNIMMQEDTGRPTGVPWPALALHSGSLQETFMAALRAGRSRSGAGLNIT